MPFKMIALRTVYRPDEGKEYFRGASFTVKTELDKDRLLKARRAKVDDTKPVEPKRAPVVQKVMTPEPEPAPASEPEAAPVGFASFPDSNNTVEVHRRNRYRRTDVRSED
jgi:hypothetical protein